MVEIVARALYECWPDWDSGEAVDGFQVTPAGPIPWSAIVEMDNAEPYFTAARAAIAAMREPTEKMRETFRVMAPQYDDPPTTGADYWEYGIDAALEEESSPSQTS